MLSVKYVVPARLCAVPNGTPYSPTKIAEVTTEYLRLFIHAPLRRSGLLAATTRTRQLLRHVTHQPVALPPIYVIALSYGNLIAHYF